MGEVVNISGVNIYTLGLFSSLAFLWGSFVFYKKAIVSHFEENNILDVVVVSAFWSFLVGRAVFVLENLSIFVKHWSRIFLMVDFPGISRFGVLLGFVIGALLVIKKKKGKYFDYFDILSLAYLSGVSVFLSLSLLIRFSLAGLVLAVLYLTLFLVLWRVENAYRHFAWYRGSKTFARTGLVSGFSVAMIGGLYLLEMFLYKNTALVGLIIGFSFLFLGLALVYSRSGRLLADDLSFLKLWRQKKQK